MSCLISIIVPVYNVEDYISDCIDSILNQTFKDFELLLIDDGSTDDSGNICDSYIAKDLRVKVIHTKNHGVSKSRNLGIKNAKGKYIMFCDSDDYVDMYWCEKLYNSIRFNSNSFVLCPYFVYNQRKDGENIKIENIQENKEIITNKKFYFSDYKIKLSASACNKIYEKEILINNNIKFCESLSLGEDKLFNLDYLRCLGDKVIILKDPLYHYILREKESLDYKYYPDMFSIYTKLNKITYDDAKLYNANDENFNKWFWLLYFYNLQRVIVSNTFHKDNKDSFLKKFYTNYKIVKSSEFRMCIKNLTDDDIDKEYLNVLRSFNYMKIFMYQEGITYNDLLRKIVDKITYKNWITKRSK